MRETTVPEKKRHMVFTDAKGKTVAEASARTIVGCFGMFDLLQEHEGTPDATHATVNDGREYRRVGRTWRRLHGTPAGR